MLKLLPHQQQSRPRKNVVVSFTALFLRHSLSRIRLSTGEAFGRGAARWCRLIALIAWRKTSNLRLMVRALVRRRSKPVELTSRNLVPMQRLHRPSFLMRQLLLNPKPLAGCADTVLHISSNLLGHMQERPRSCKGRRWAWHSSPTMEEATG